MTDWNFAEYLGQTVCLALKDGSCLTGVLEEISEDGASLDLHTENGWVMVKVRDIRSLTESHPTGTGASDNAPQAVMDYDSLLKPYSPSGGPTGLVFTEPDLPVHVDIESEMAEQAWNRFSNRFEAARKARELEPRFQRSTGLANEARSESRQHPKSRSWRMAWYLLAYHAGDYAQGLQALEELKQASQLDSLDYRNAAWLARETGRSVSACEWLANGIRSETGKHEPLLWSMYLELVAETKFFELLSEPLQRWPEMTDDERNLLRGGFLWLTHNECGPERAQQLFESLRDLGTYRPLEGILDELRPLGVTPTKDPVPSPRPALPQSSWTQGTVVKILDGGRKGFISDAFRREVFFRQQAITDPELQTRLTKGSLTGTKVEVLVKTSPDGKFQAEEIRCWHTLAELKQAVETAENRGAFSRAVELHNRILQRDPTSVASVTSLGKLQSLLEREKVPQGDTPYARARQAEVVVCDVDLALGHYRQAIKEGDHLQESAERYLILLLAERRVLEALKEARRLARQPGLIEVLIRVARSGVEQALFSEAALLLGQIRELQPSLESSREFQTLLGLACFHLSRWPEAAQALQSAYQENPEDNQLRTCLAETYYRLGNIESARSLLTAGELEQLEERLQLEDHRGRIATLDREKKELLQQQHEARKAEQNKVPARGVVLVLGESRVGPQDLKGIAKRVGLEAHQLDLHLDYDKGKAFNLEELKGGRYAGVVAGPLPHKTNHSAGYSSAHERMNQEPGFPPSEKTVVSSGELKLTKTSFERALLKLMLRIGDELGLDEAQRKSVAEREAELSKPQQTPRRSDKRGGKRGRRRHR